MRLIIFCALFAAVFADQEHLIPTKRLNEIADLVNSDGSSTWKAAKFSEDSEFLNTHHRVGVLDTEDAPADIGSGKDETANYCENNGLPKNFDARRHWPRCRSVIGHIYDQGNCGSCWAVSTVSVFSDRVCIKSEGKISASFSSQQVTSCCTKCSGRNGCRGGWPFGVWKYIKSYGIVTGGDYESNEGCQPYEIEHCDHHVSGTYKPCSKEYVNATECKRHCYNKFYPKKFRSDLIKADSYYDVAPCAAQNEIYNNGPIIATFFVYEDFYTYKSGVYQHTQGIRTGKHAVSVIGWGEENNVPYWLVKNSWNSNWGDKGIFKIKRGDNEVWFEEEFSTIIPRV